MSLISLKIMTLKNSWNYETLKMR